LKNPKHCSNTKEQQHEHSQTQNLHPNEKPNEIDDEIERNRNNIKAQNSNEIAEHNMNRNIIIEIEIAEHNRTKLKSKLN
jgi:hypothetical protein